MAKLSLNSIPSDVFKVNAADSTNSSQARADIVGLGRLLAYEYARRGTDVMRRANNSILDVPEAQLSATEYRTTNEKFRADAMLYAATKACEMVGQEAPSSFEELKRNGRRFASNKQFYNVLQGIIQDVITPILPAVYSEAVDIFAETVEVGFGETYAVSVDSNDIPIFQDTAWGAQRSIPRNRLYSKDYTLNPQPRACMLTAKWTQLVSNGWDFGRFFANLAAGMYAKTMGMWNAAMTAAASNTALIPSGLKYNFSAQNWVTLANKIAAVNNTSISNLLAFGGAVALAKVLPTQVTGSTNANMDAAIATLLGADYVRAGYLGEYMAVRLMPLTDVVIPGTQNGDVTTMLPNNKVWVMAGNGRKPLTIAYNPEGGITFEMDPLQTGDFEIGINMTFCIDSVAIFSSRLGLITIA